MDNPVWSYIGFAAAFLTMFAFIPQIFKVVKTKSVGDVSVVTLGQLLAGVTLWMVYGIARRDPVIILANTVTLMSLCVLLWFYKKYK
jgi:MtN3 and saliva related transmembrane protein